MKASTLRTLEELRREVKRKQSGANTLEAVNILEHIAPCYYDIHADVEAGGHQYYNLPGGRGSCKSSYVSTEIVNQIMLDPTGLSNAIVFRRIAGTMRESVFSQISWAIAELGVSHLWKGMVSPMQWEYKPTGAQIIFRGLDDSSKLKSIKPRKGSFRFVWFEEFAELPGANIQRSVLQSVVRGGSNFAVFRSFNPPQSANNWANQLILQPDPKALTLLTNYTMVPPEWLGESFLYEANRLKELNPTLYEHEYMGVPTGTGGEVFTTVETRTITDEEINNFDYFRAGIDFGFAVDPAVYILLSYDKKKETVYIFGEIYKKHCSNSDLYQAIKEQKFDEIGKKYSYNAMFHERYEERVKICCDAAEPKSISDLRNLGLDVYACKKFPGSVLYGIKWLQRRKIIIDPARCPNAAHEFTSYEYSTTKDGEFLADVPDRDNHCIDAVRYALDRDLKYSGQSA